MRNLKIKITLLAVLITLAAAASYLSRDKYFTIDSGFIEVMGTFGHIIVVADDQDAANSAIDSAFSEIRRLDEMMSDYLDDSELSQVNRGAYPESVKVSDELFEVLRHSIHYSRLSNGAFDVTIGPVVDLWRNAELNNKTPSQRQIQEARSKVGFEKLILEEDNKSVRFKVNGMRLDLGAIAKGYAIDRATEIIIKSQCAGALVDIGGDMRSFGKAPRKRKSWIVGLQNPWGDSEVLLKLKLDNAAIATSGDYRRFVEIDGKKMSHIINPASLNSAEGMTSVTIITQKAIDADSLATTVSVMGLEKGLDLIENTEDTEAIVISKDTQNLIKTSNARQYIFD